MALSPPGSVLTAWAATACGENQVAELVVVLLLALALLVAALEAAAAIAVLLAGVVLLAAAAGVVLAAALGAAGQTALAVLVLVARLALEALLGFNVLTERNTPKRAGAYEGERAGSSGLQHATAIALRADLAADVIEPIRIHLFLLTSSPQLCAVLSQSRPQRHPAPTNRLVVPGRNV